MKNIAVYGRAFKDSLTIYIKELLNGLKQSGATLHFYEPFYHFLKERLPLPEEVILFSRHDPLDEDVELIVSIGGDGTLMDSTIFTRSGSIPIMGINTGRLGFLSSVSLDEIDAAVHAVRTREYQVDQRTMLRVDSETPLFGDQNFALNELTIHKNDSASMIIIHVHVNGKFLNSYWADGLIIATPTGSTAYSLSCGGPIVMPGSDNFIIAPIAPHNLNVRPIVIPDDSEIMLEMEGRSPYFLASLDSRSVTLPPETRLKVTKSDFQISLLRLQNYDYLWTIRNKLNWGLDTRN
ncbi:MAG: NAD kinase [Bacteroidota bacterium]